MADDKRINKKVLLQYKEWLVQKYAVNSVNSMLAALNQFLEFLNVGNLKVKRIKVQKQSFLQDQKEVTEKECRKLIATAMAEGKEQLALCIKNNSMYRNSDQRNKIFYSGACKIWKDRDL